jgi:S1-C subfamily serine protease
MTSATNSSSTKKKFLAAAASLAIAGAIGLGAVTSATVPVFAEAVRVDAAQAPGFADVVEKVKPAVVSVQVKSPINPASDDGGSFGGPGGGFFGGPGLDDLPDNHPMKRFFREFRGGRTASVTVSAASAASRTGRSACARPRRVPASSFPKTDISSPTITSSRTARATRCDGQWRRA